MNISKRQTYKYEFPGINLGWFMGKKHENTHDTMLFNMQ